MKNPAVRLTILQTHPVQYLAPWFRHIAENCTAIELTVLYAAKPNAAQQSTGFGAAFEWDVPLLDGYRSVFARDNDAVANFHSGSYRGVDVPEIVDALAATRPDVVLIPGWHSITYMRALTWCRGNRVPTIWRGDTHGIGRTSIPWRIRTRYLLHRFDWHLSVGLNTRAYLRRFGIHPDRIFASPHHIDNERFRSTDEARATARTMMRGELGIPESAFVILAAGKLGAHKRPHDVIDAVARMDAGAVVVFAGDGPARTSAEQHANAKGTDVRFTGFVNQSKMPALYAISDVVVVAGEESWGLVMNEALAGGVPIVANDRAGATRDLVVPGETGERFVFGDVSSLSHALEAVRHGATGGRYDAESCMSHVARYSVTAATAGLAAACDAAVRASSPRILVLAGGLFTLTGMERSTFEALRAMRRWHARVHCSVNNWAPPMWSEGPHLIMTMAEAIGATWSTARYKTRLNRSLNPFRQVPVVFDILSTSASILRDALRLRATHIFIPEFVTALRSFPALVLLRLSGRRVVLKLPTPVPEGPFYGRVWRWLLDPVVSTYVANSRFTKGTLSAHGLGAGKTVQIGNVIVSRSSARSPRPKRSATRGSSAADISSAGNTVAARDLDQRPRLVFMGQIIPAKGVMELLEATADCIARGVDVELDVLGPMTGWALPEVEVYREALLARANRDDLRGRIHFLGFHEDVRSVLDGARMLCCPSLAEQREGFGMVVIEAKDAGIPVVVFPSGGLPELIDHGVDGWICRDFTPVALADGICAVIEAEDSGVDMGAASRRSMWKYSYEEFTRAWLGVFSIAASEE